MIVEAVVVAAGYSSRAGAFKPGLDVLGKTVLERCVAGLAAHCSRIIVVGGYRIERVREILAPDSKVEIVFNPRYPEGMFTSVQAGMRRVRGDRILFTPGDYPLLSSEVCHRLLQEDGEIVIPVFQGRKGHPIVLSGRMAAAVAREDSGSNLRAFIQKQGFRTLEVDDEGILIDLDTPEDYTKILERHQQRITK